MHFQAAWNKPLSGHARHTKMHDGTLESVTRDRSLPVPLK